MQQNKKESSNLKENIREDLMEYKFALNVLKKNPCSKQENKEYESIVKHGGKLPEGVYPYSDYSMDGFYTVTASDLTEDELKEYLFYKQLSMLKTIKNCVVFFAVLTIISLIFAFFALLR